MTLAAETHRIGHHGLVIDGRYRLEELIGAGGFGEVWRAIQQVEGEAVREVALKLLVAPPRVAGGTTDNTGGRADDWLKEVRAVRNVECSAIATIYDVGVARDRDLAFISMMLLDGENLDERLHRGPIPWRRALSIAREVAAALIACHRVGVTHCDLKPQNIFLRSDGRVFVLDFGVAKLGADTPSSSGPATPMLASAGPEDFVTAEVTGSELPPSFPASTTATKVFGTPGYIAPERYSGDPPSAAADVYALGVVLFQMITGHLPYNLPSSTSAASFASSNQSRNAYRAELHTATVRGLVRKLADDVRGVPSAVTDLVRSMMSMRPDDRDADRLLDVIDRTWARPYGVPDPPYVGLEAFDAERAGYIAGRDADIEQVVDKLQHDRAIVLVGPSGCGKSSLAIAGVAARVDEQLLEDTDGWRTEVIRPSDGATGLRLAEPGDRPSDTTEGTVVVVDQFEEVLGLEPADLEAFGTALIALVNGDAPVWVGDQCIGREHHARVVATVRDDRFGDVAALPQLGRIPESNVYTVRGVEPNAIADIISAPAREAGYEVERAAEVVGEARDILASDPSALPLVQFALTRWWELRDTTNRRLTAAAWAELGGIEGALAGAAQKLYDGLGADGRKHMRHVLIELFAANGTRVRVPEDQILRHPEAGAVLSRLVERRLVRRHERAGESAILEVVHEALALRWPMLHGWLEESRAERELLQDARYDAERWARAGKPHEMLWRGARLQEALALEDRLGSARAFIAEARVVGNRRRNLRRGLVSALFLVLVGFVVVLIVFNVRSSKARKAAEQAREEAIAAQKDAEEAKQHAEDEKQRAEDAARIAQEQTSIAEAQARIAKEQTNRAENEEQNAKNALVRAEENQEKFMDASAKLAAARETLAKAKQSEEEARRLLVAAQKAEKRAKDEREAARQETEEARKEMQRALDLKRQIDEYMDKDIPQPP